MIISDVVIANVVSISNVAIANMVISDVVLLNMDEKISSKHWCGSSSLWQIFSSPYQNAFQIGL